jgi:hypothetical protein
MAQDIVTDLQAALAQLRLIVGNLLVELGC